MSQSPVALILALGLLAWLCGTAVIAGAAPNAAVPVAPDAAAAQAAIQKARASGKCLLSDLTQGEKGALFHGLSAVLPQGRYRLHAGVAAAPLGTLAVGAIKIHVHAGTVEKDFSAVHFPQNDEFVDLLVDFTLPAARKVPVSVDWRAEESAKTKGLLGKARWRCTAPRMAPAPATARLSRLAATMPPRRSRLVTWTRA